MRTLGKLQTRGPNHKHRTSNLKRLKIIARPVFERDRFSSSVSLCWCSLRYGDACAGRAVVFKKIAGAA
jgi:hypothetical protein